jgi:hypothetical protein
MQLLQWYDDKRGLLATVLGHESSSKDHIIYVVLNATALKQYVTATLTKDHWSL